MLAECLPLLRGLPLEEVVMIDLDRLGSCTPELGSPGDDYWQLPYARELEDVFEVGAWGWSWVVEAASRRAPGGTGWSTERAV